MQRGPHEVFSEGTTHTHIAVQVVNQTSVGKLQDLDPFVMIAFEVHRRVSVNFS